MFDYFKANEQEQYLFLQLPLMLIKDNQFKGLSSDAKILYSLLLNRTSLSARNGWADGQGNVYIIYTQEEIMTDLNCWEKKATKSMKELKEIGLVKSVRQGLGRPNIIYVMNFATALKYQPKSKKEPENPVKSMICQNDISGSAQTTFQETVKSTSLEVSNGHTIYNDLNKINNSDNDSNQISSYRSENSVLKDVEKEQDRKEQEKEQKEKTDRMRYDEISDQSVFKREIQKNKEGFVSAALTQSEKHLKPSAPKYDYNTYLEIVKENIDYDTMVIDTPTYKDRLDGVVHVIASTLATEFDGGYIGMGDEKVPASAVKGVFMQIDSSEIDYFLENFDRQTEPTTKLNAYIRTSLYKNHGMTEFYWANRVHVDMPQYAKQKLQRSQNKEN